MTKDEVTPPTVATNLIFLSCLINASKRRDIATVNIPGAFMYSDWEGKDLHMKVEGKMVDILTKNYPNLYSKYNCIEDNKKDSQT